MNLVTSNETYSYIQLNLFITYSLPIELILFLDLSLSSSPDKSELDPSILIIYLEVSKTNIR